MYPVILMSGKAGSGKDTVAEMLCDDTVGFKNAQRVALADPLKRFARSVLGMEEEVLWGPSELRSKEYSVDDLDHRFREYTGTNTCAFWCDDVAQATDKSYDEVQAYLVAWFTMFVAPNQSEGKKITARSVLQTLGTEFGRNIDNDVWVKVAKAAADDLLAGRGVYDRTQGVIPGASTGAKQTDVVVITDGRFRNEVLAVNSWGGATIKIWNPKATGLTGEAGKHASETEQDTIPDWWFTATLMNNKEHGLEPLRRCTRALANDLFVGSAEIRGGHNRFTLGY
jgi:hypothetical protein